ncbi:MULTISPECIES: hypothetical protein [unclassified Streptomyces]|uniref:hypothetical protein n=1 Tax=unclassified Streptomyces TaxID=2593676 RepID=UPI001BE98D5A|nr:MULTISPECIES: hypothetical protein [unclassified Streptomyces]MBT2403098.1 hypothetical protein [Streptomyces sp. ISL-21]MBT2610225.1 hypothetical protein [Streptomyces sp. ISL-87]
MNRALTPQEQEQLRIAAALKELADVLKGPDLPTSKLNDFWTLPRGHGQGQGQAPVQQQGQGQVQQQAPVQQQAQGQVQQQAPVQQQGQGQVQQQAPPKSEQPSKKSADSEKTEGSF